MEMKLFKPQKTNTKTCPYAPNTTQKPATSPHDALPNIPEAETGSKTLPQHQQGWRNLGRLFDQGASPFFYEMAARTKQKFFKIDIGTQNIYMVTDGKIAKELLTKYPELGRGDILEPFTHMVGRVFFAEDGLAASEPRKVFLNTIARGPINFERIAQVNQRTFDSMNLTSNGGIDDLYASVAWHTIGCIAACFVGTYDLSALPPDTHKIFMDATRLITKASMDPLSRLIHPGLRSDFRATSKAMADIAQKLLSTNIDNICKGNNYIWDLGIFRAEQLHPEMNFDDCTHFEENNPKATIVRDLIENDRFIREHGPLTIFASSNVGATMFYMLDVLSQRPDVVDKMHEEIARVLGKEPFTYNRIADLPYVQAVVQETLWQATPIPNFPRAVLNPFQANINGETISFQKGDMLMFLFRPMHGPNRAFSPEKWLEGDDLFSFGAGPRRCPASPFAKQMLTQFLVDMDLHGLRIMPTRKPTYTTRNGLLGPDYQPEDPLSAEVEHVAGEEYPRAIARL
ncbi:Cytochrome P450 [Legionella steigerwaltii]|uniref:Cytochrome P450 n=2 Tax=Legionella steigerwaltii TaxID=460 RepID=A0A378L849_9GAMM|nr:cytochrome P450 [Legionella steigerwaltii]KTD76091.1 Cytochrome P450 [Legionella steigerwaltii]STY22092.1 Cytochrome P450 [Legionella steigerwaltii]